MKKSFSIWLFFAVVFLVPLSIYGIVNWYEINKSGLPFLGEKINGKAHTIASFEMTNQEGQKQTLENWKNKIVVANFFFTHCPVVCPKMTTNLETIQTAFATDKDLTIASFSVDPERDNIQTLKKYAEHFSIHQDKWSLLTGEKREIYKLARKSFLVVATDGDGGENDFIHSDKLVLIDKHQRIRGYYSGTEQEDIQQMIKDINKLKHEN